MNMNVSYIFWVLCGQSRILLGPCPLSPEHMSSIAVFQVSLSLRQTSLAQFVHSLTVTCLIVMELYQGELGCAQPHCKRNAPDGY